MKKLKQDDLKVIYSYFNYKYFKDELPCLDITWMEEKVMNENNAIGCFNFDMGVQ